MEISTARVRVFWSRVQKSDGCWEWLAGKYPRGYGLFYVGGGREHRVTMGAHRVSWTLVNGPIPAGLNVCHRCDNPSCVRPDHLFLGTQRTNMRDAANKGRIFEQTVTHCPEGHEYSPDNTYVYDRDNGGTYRVCRACHADRRERRVRDQTRSVGRCKCGEALPSRRVTRCNDCNRSLPARVVGEAEGGVSTLAMNAGALLAGLRWR